MAEPRPTFPHFTIYVYLIRHTVTWVSPEELKKTSCCRPSVPQRRNIKFTNDASFHLQGDRYSSICLRLQLRRTPVRHVGARDSSIPGGIPWEEVRSWVQFLEARLDVETFLPLCLLNMRRILYQNACIAKLKTR